MHIKVAVIILSLLLCLGCSNIRDTPQSQSGNEVGHWVHTPVDFVPRIVDETVPMTGQCQQFDLGESDYFVVAGPFMPLSSTDAEEGYFCLSIEHKGRGSSTVISDLKVDLDLVSPDRAEMELSEYVSFESNAGLVAIDLGQSSFRFQFVDGEG